MERSTLYFVASTGLKARLICLTDLGVTADFAVLTGCIARRTPRGTSRRLRNPMAVDPQRCGTNEVEQ